MTSVKGLFTSVSSLRAAYKTPDLNDGQLKNTNSSGINITFQTYSMWSEQIDRLEFDHIFPTIKYVVYRV